LKSIQQLAGPRDIKSIHSIGARSIPKVQRSGYLELYMLKREKDRLEKEMAAVDKRRNIAVRQLDNISERTETLQKELSEKPKIKTYKNVPTSPLKRMSMSY